MHSTHSTPEALDIEIEQLESRIAPDGGETVLPLPHPVHHR